MNYRHAFHAGNFADLVKHAALIELMARLTREPGPLAVIDTHAGRGLYDLAGPEARRSGVAEAGVLRLMQAPDAPPEFAALAAVVRALNGGGPVRRYPGSPWLVAGMLRPGDRLVACELRPEEHKALAAAMGGKPGVETLCADGYTAAPARCPREGRVLALIDPPFESPDDYGRAIGAVAALRRRNPRAQAMVWLPLKDLETFDSFLRDLEDEISGPLLVAECRMRPLSDPMRMNGCALVLAPATAFDAPLASITGWVAQTLGDGGASAVYRLPSS